jgi:hypothetical protein
MDSKLSKLGNETTRAEYQGEQWGGQPGTYTLAEIDQMLRDTGYTTAGMTVKGGRLIDSDGNTVLVTK